MLTGPYVSRAAEKVLWKEEFRNPSMVHRNGGVLVGGCILKDGLPLNGVGQYATYAPPPALLFRNQLVFEVVFTPNSAASEAVERPILCTVPGATASYIIKTSAGALIFAIHDIPVGALPLAAYSDYWLAGEKNRILVSSDGATTDIWLNGIQLMSGFVGAWIPIPITNIRVGANAAPTTFFDGTIHQVKIRNRLLTQLDVDAIQNNSLYTYI